MPPHPRPIVCDGWNDRGTFFFRFFEYLNDDNTIVFVYIFMKEIDFNYHKNFIFFLFKIGTEAIKKILA